MPKLNDHNIKIMDGIAVLFRRNRSTAWQVRYKANGKWLRTTTREMQLVDARRAAEDIVLEARFKQRHGMPVVTRRFASVAATAIARMNTALTAGDGKTVYTHYIGALQNYLVPYLGNHGIANVDAALLRKFAVWRTDQMKHEPRSSTVNTHNAALSRVFDVALELGYMNKAQLPVLQNKPRDSDRRPDFTLVEYRHLYRFMRSWVKQGKSGKSRNMRMLLRDYVLILANTGMRHGTESQGLKWKHVSEFVDHDRRYLAMWVDGKTGGRELIARHNCVTYLKRIHARADDLKHLTWDQLLTAGRDELVFRLPDGTQSKSLHQTFEVLLTDAELLVAERIEIDERMQEAMRLAKNQNLVIKEVSRGVLDGLTGTTMHQGIALVIKPFQYAKFEELLKKVAKPGLLIGLDGVTDPHNLGAIVRSAAAFGADGVVIPERRTAAMTGSAWKSSAGAAARLPISQVTNLVRSLEDAKKAGYFIVGLDAEGDESLPNFSLSLESIYVIVGSEGKGLSRLVRETCDLILSIPMRSDVESLNASVATAIVMHQVAANRAAATL